MIERSSVVILEHLKAYIRAWQKLEREYRQIPSWRSFKQLRNIRQREKLTKAYIERMKEWGIMI